MKTTDLWGLATMIIAVINNALISIITVCLVITCGWNKLQGAEPKIQQKIIARTVEDSTQVKKLKKKSPTGAMIRAVVFPGWGQWYNEQKIKAGIAFLADGFLVGLALHFNRKASDSEPGSSARNFYIDRRNLTFWLIGGVTLLSMLDAYVDAYLYDFDTGPDLALRVGMLPTSTSMEMPMMLGLSLRAKF